MIQTTAVGTTIIFFDGHPDSATTNGTISIGTGLADTDPTKIDPCVVDDFSDWIMTCYTDYREEASLEKGDLIRVGITSTNGYSDILTVLDVVPASRLYRDPALNLLEHRLDGGVAEWTNDYIDLSTPINCYRLNRTISTTKPPFGLIANFLSDTSVAALLADRKTVQHSVYETRDVADPSSKIAQRTYYPVHKLTKVKSHEHRIKFDHGVKSVTSIKLVGYSVFGKKRAGFAHLHESVDDDFIIVNIKGVRGEVVSNNDFASGAFAVLHTGTDAEASTGAIEYYAYDANGLANYKFETPTSCLRQLDFEFLNRKGEPAHFGRMHLWLKVCVLHG
tara:strand:+ start:443 stop:1447 length:1005 start_codon:yes stop_codon:yes gene_type:complete